MKYLNLPFKFTSTYILNLVYLICCVACCSILLAILHKYHSFNLKMYPKEQGKRKMSPLNPSAFMIPSLDAPLPFSPLNSMNNTVHSTPGSSSEDSHNEDETPKEKTLLIVERLLSREQALDRSSRTARRCSRARCRTTPLTAHLCMIHRLCWTE